MTPSIPEAREVVRRIRSAVDSGRFGTSTSNSYLLAVQAADTIEALLEERERLLGKPCHDKDGVRFLRWDCLAATPYGGLSNPTLEHYNHTAACRRAPREEEG